MIEPGEMLRHAPASTSGIGAVLRVGTVKGLSEEAGRLLVEIAGNTLDLPAAPGTYTEDGRVLIGERGMIAGQTDEPLPEREPLYVLPQLLVDPAAREQIDSLDTDLHESQERITAAKAEIDALGDEVKVAATTANIGNLVVTEGADFPRAVVQKLLANEVFVNNLYAQMIDTTTRKNYVPGGYMAEPRDFELIAEKWHPHFGETFDPKKPLGYYDMVTPLSEWNTLPMEIECGYVPAGDDYRLEVTGFLGNPQVVLKSKTGQKKVNYRDRFSWEGGDLTLRFEAFDTSTQNKVQGWIKTMVLTNEPVVDIHGNNAQFDESLAVGKDLNVAGALTVNGRATVGGYEVINEYRHITDLNAKADKSHSHPIGDVTGLQAALDGKAPKAHTHTQSQISGLTTALNGKAPKTHTHTMSQVTGLNVALDKVEGQISHVEVVESALYGSHDENKPARFICARAKLRFTDGEATLSLPAGLSAIMHVTITPGPTAYSMRLGLRNVNTSTLTIYAQRPGTNTAWSGTMFVTILVIAQ